MNCQRLEPEGEDSQRSRQDSDQEWAKSTRRTRPRRMKREAPMGAGGGAEVELIRRWRGGGGERNAYISRSRRT